MTINQVKCDGCGKEADKIDKSGIFGYVSEPPMGWQHFQGNDLCPDCTKKVEEFIQGLKV